MRIFEEVRDYIDARCRTINSLYGVDPKVYIQFAADGTSLHGFCNTAYHSPQMYIELVVPCTFVLSPKRTADLNVMICHEYCHFLDALSRPAKDRHASGEGYLVDSVTRKVDEHRTWRQTCELAKKLGIWNKQFFTCLKEYEYTTEITY